MKKVDFDKDMWVFLFNGYKKSGDLLKKIELDK